MDSGVEEVSEHVCDHNHESEWLSGDSSIMILSTSGSECWRYADIIVALAYDYFFTMHE